MPLLERWHITCSKAQRRTKIVIKNIKKLSGVSCLNLVAIALALGAGESHAQSTALASAGEVSGGGGVNDGDGRLPDSAGLVRVALRSRILTLMLEYQGGQQVMRFRGRTEVYPIRIARHGSVGEGATVNGGAFSIIPLSAEGQATFREFLTQSNGNQNYVFAGPEIAYDLGWVNANALSGAGLTLGRFRVSTSLVGGARGDADNSEGTFGVTYRVEGELLFNVGCHSAPGFRIRATTGSADGMICHGIRVGGQAGGMFNFLDQSFTRSEGGAIGYQVGAPGPGGNFFIQFEGNRNDHSNVSLPNGQPGNDSGESYYMGGAAGFHF